MPHLYAVNQRNWPLISNAVFEASRWAAVVIPVVLDSNLLISLSKSWFHRPSLHSFRCGLVPKSHIRFFSLRQVASVCWN